MRHDDLAAWVRRFENKTTGCDQRSDGAAEVRCLRRRRAPTRAAESFAEKQGIPLYTMSDLIQTSKGEYLAAKQIEARTNYRGKFSRKSCRASLHDIYWPQDHVLDRASWSSFHPADAMGRGDCLMASRSNFSSLTFNWRNGNVWPSISRASKIPVKDSADYEKKLRANGRDWCVPEDGAKKI